MNKDTKTISIGGASGYWGDATHATAQLLGHENLDFLSYDYLAEITMSIMARMRMKDPNAGYAADFVTQAMKPNLEKISERGVKVLSNAGGLNPSKCAAALGEVISALGLDLKIGVVEGDDLIARAKDFSNSIEMFSGEVFPEKPLASINAYLGAFPIAAALDAGADIVITGRCVDSALPLAACIHSFGWLPNDLDKLAAGSLAGHIIECGVQATGGNFTDWEVAGDIGTIGYPVAEISADGSIIVTKPVGTSGLVSKGTVAEQILYEIGDPKAYLLPDVRCDFSNVTVDLLESDRVAVTNARGSAPSGQLKVSATYVDGYRAGYTFGFNGRHARKKARLFAEAGIRRSREKLRALNAPDYSDTLIEIEGGRTGEGDYEEVYLKTAVRHDDAKAVGLFLKDTMGNGLATPPGLNGFTGAGRPKPSPVVRLFSFLIDVADVPVRVDVDGSDIGYLTGSMPLEQDSTKHQEPSNGSVLHPNCVDINLMPLSQVYLEELAWGRSGDKGDSANIGIVARKAEFLPYIWAYLTPKAIGVIFSDKANGAIKRYYLPGMNAMNIVMENSLGGGGIASLRNDAQGKGFAQRLLAEKIVIPTNLVVETEA